MPNDIGMPSQTIAPTFTRDALDVLSSRRVREMLGLHESTMWRMRQRKEFPEPIRISPGRVGWLRRDIEAWIEARRGKTPDQIGRR